MTTINYIIATYSGKYRDYEDKELVLQNQLERLYNYITEGSLVTRVTVVCPTPRHVVYEKYYQKEKWIHLFEDKKIRIDFMDYVGENKHHSYDQWIQGYMKHPECEYNLLMEDDYCVYNNPNFDIELVDLYRQKFPDNIGYLCTYACDHNEHKYIASISNGLVSSKTFKKLGNNLLELYYRSRDPYPQLKFSYMFTDNGVSISDCSENFKAVFWHSDDKKIVNFSRLGIDKTCLVPVQYTTI